MGVCIDEPGEHDPSAEIDDPGLRAGQLEDLGVAPDRCDAVARHRERLGFRTSGVHREQKSVVVDGIGLGGRLATRQADWIAAQREEHWQSDQDGNKRLSTDHERAAEILTSSCRIISLGTANSCRSNEVDVIPLEITSTAATV